MARKRKPAEAVNTNEWMNTYADTVTLLLCFFVLLFSFSTVNEKKWKEIVDALSDKFPAVTQTTENPEAAATDPNDLLYQTIRHHVDQNNLGSKVEVVKDEDIVIMRFKDTILFDPDKTYLRDDGKVILGDMCAILKNSMDLIKIINIEGHTASNPKGLPEFEDTFEFSTKRAVNVLEYMLTTQNMEPKKLSAVGYGQYHPIDTNETAEGRVRNRRVEIIVHSYPKETEEKKS